MCESVGYDKPDDALNNLKRINDYIKHEFYIHHLNLTICEDRLISNIEKGIVHANYKIRISNIPLCNSVSKEYIQFTNKNYNSYIPFYFLKKKLLSQ